MNKFKTENYYREINKDSLCSCDYCRNYYKEVKAAYPELSDHLAGMGVDIENAVILPGVRIGDGAIIGANAVVGSDVEPYTVVVGNPAQFIRILGYL